MTVRSVTLGPDAMLYPLSKAMWAWGNPVEKGVDLFKIGPYPDLTGWSDDFLFTNYAQVGRDLDVSSWSIRERVVYTVLEMHRLYMVYGVSMETMHEEFMKQVLEYHDYCQIDIYSSYAGLPTREFV